jgi:hypothetical protein
MGGVRWRRAGAVACAVALLLAGCTGDDPGEGAHPDDPAPPATSPLAEILGWGMATDGVAAPGVSEGERQRHLQVEQLVADCMAEHGFEYVPVSLDDRRAGPFDEAYALDPADFAQQYGYGVTTLTVGAEDEAFQDPNQEIMDSLAPEERAEYERALWGADAAVDPDAADQGCRMHAEAEVYGVRDPDDRAQEMERFAALFEALDDLSRRIENDPRLADSEVNWARCMAAAGYPGFTRPHDARQAVFDQYAALSAQQSDPDSEALADLREFELTLAPVDYACREEHVDGPRWQVAQELEAQFVEEHRTELEAYRDWMSGATPDG